VRIKLSVTVFIDESGEAGISKIRSEKSPGASPYFVLAAAVMPPAACIHAKKVLAEVESQVFKKWDHATDLSHSQTVFWSRRASENNLRFFAVVSNKQTLGEYSVKIRENPEKFYNKCAVYLLERVGKYLLARNVVQEPPTVIFEHRNHDYDAMRRYIGKIKENPMHTDARFLRAINPFAIVTRAKSDEPLLKYADLAAHAVYQCTNKTRANHMIPEPRYLEELSKRFGADERGNIVGNGIKCIHNLEQLELDKDVEEKIRRMKAIPMRR